MGPSEHPIYHHLGGLLASWPPSMQASNIIRFEASLHGPKSRQNPTQAHQKTRQIIPEIIQIPTSAKSYFLLYLQRENRILRAEFRLTNSLSKVTRKQTPKQNRSSSPQCQNNFQNGFHKSPRNRKKSDSGPPRVPCPSCCSGLPRVPPRAEVPK